MLHVCLAGPGGSKINTKNALQAMLNGRLQQGGPGQPGMAVGQPGLPPGASPAPPTASSSPGVMAPPGAAVVAGPGAPTGSFLNWFMDLKPGRTVQGGLLQGD